MTTLLQRRGALAALLGVELSTIGILVLLASNALSLWRLSTLRHELAMKPPGVSQMGLESVVNASLRSGSGADVQIKRLQNRTVILFIFRPQDCPASIQELESLGKLNSARPDLAIYAVLVHGDSAEARQTERSFSLSFL